MTFFLATNWSPVCCATTNLVWDHDPPPLDKIITWPNCATPCPNNVPAESQLGHYKTSRPLIMDIM